MRYTDYQKPLTEAEKTSNQPAIQKAGGPPKINPPPILEVAPMPTKTLGVTTPLGAAPPAVEGNWKPITPSTAKSPEQQQVLQQQQEKAESIQFYTNVGQPELAEKYAAPEIPAGQKVVSVTEVTPAPLSGVAAIEGNWVSKTTGEPVSSKAPYVQVVTAPKEQPKGLGEQIAEINPVDIGFGAAEAILGRQIQNRSQIVAFWTEALGSGIPGIKGTPTEFLGGAVSAVEAPIYAAATAWGVKGLPQPATVTGAIIGSVIAGRVSDEYMKLNAGSPAYGAGSIAGELLLFAGTAKGAEVIFRGATRIAPVLASAGVKGTLARAGLSAGLGAAFGGVMSGGNTEAILQGALIGAGASVAVELGVKAFNAIKPRLPERFGGAKRLVEGPEVMGKTGEPVKTYISEPVKELGGRRIEVVADVTKNPASYMELADEYIGKNIPTGHATLEGEHFNLGKGGETLLKGFRSKALGGRSLGFYAAPGEEGKVVLYGGYVGVGEGYSDMARIVFGGKQSALVTLKTPVAPEYLPEVSGLTAIPPENVAGASLERQVATTTAYDSYVGSMFKSEGKVGVFQIQQKPQGLIGKIPVLRDLFSGYSNITVYRGSYAPVAEAVVGKSLDINAYSSSYRSVVSLPSLTAYPSVAPIIIQPKTQPKTSSQRTIISTPKISTAMLSAPSESSVSEFSSRKTVPSLPSLPSSSLPKPSRPVNIQSLPKTPSFDVTPSSPFTQPSNPRSPPAYSPPRIPEFPFPSEPPTSQPSFPRSPVSVDLALPSSKDWIQGFQKPPSRKRFGSGLYSWQFPVKGAKTALKAIGVEPTKRKRKR